MVLAPSLPFHSGARRPTSQDKALNATAFDIAERAPSRDDSRERLDRLAELSQRLLARARALGASQAEVSCTEDRGMQINVRMGAVETVESTRDRGVGVTVYFGRRKGVASTADLRDESLEATLAQACLIARHTEDDPAAGLGDAERMAHPDAAGDWPDFDLWHPWELTPDAAVDLALACETAGRDSDQRIGNSDGASVMTSRSLGVYANSHGFVGRERDTQHSISCSLIAGRGDAMQSQSWYTLGLSPGDLEAPEAVGRQAAARTVARLSPRTLATGSMPVLFAPEVARSLIGHLINAAAGSALYRRASFLLDSRGQTLLPAWCSIVEKPFLRRGLRSGAFDAEGVAASESALIAEGVLERYILSSYSARKLGLSSTGNAGGVFNLDIATNAADMVEIARGMGEGLLVTELMGQGVNTTTGDYSRGAAGFRIENGEIAYPVDGITIAGNLREMYRAIEAIGSDIDPRSYIRCGSILVGRMTVAGAE
jgi:PmbA protein